MTRLQLILIFVPVGVVCGLVARTDVPSAFALGCAAIFLVILFVSARARRGTQLHNRGQTLMGEGRLVEGLALFEQAQKLVPRSPTPKFNIGLANLWLWRLDAARTSLDEATTSFDGRGLRIIGVPALLLIAAFQNDTTRYAKLLNEVTKLDVTRSSFTWMAKAVMAARAKQWREVVDALSIEHTRQLGGSSRAVADALRTWATLELGGQRLPIDTVGVLGETGTGSVKAWWPEFAAFLETATRA